VLFERHITSDIPAFNNGKIPAITTAPRPGGGG
jgi:hypothetical protein